jgi:hypothetical protein|tara:strand:+ start:259 stop:666 length:408 start_codon:yes stop_codon:yes gene_type:complete
MIKNLNVVDVIDDSNPKNMNNIDAEQLKGVTNGFVEHIDCLCLDQLELKERNDLIVLMSNKLSNKGVLSLKILNLNLLANQIDKGGINGQKLSEILPHIKSVWSTQECDDVINQLNLKTKGMYYDYIYTIYQLEK